MSNLDQLKTTGRWLAAGAWPLGLFAVALVLGIYLGTPPASEADADAAAGHSEEEHASEGLWTCSMHPSVQLPSQGQCPICFMDLIPKVERAPGSLSVADAEVTRLGLESRPTRRAAVVRDLDLVGRLAFDQTRLTTISAWVPGRIDRLFVDSTGITVRAGDHLAELYSPPLYQAQIELAQAEASLARTRERNPESSLVAAQEAAVAAVRERLRLWGLSPEQIVELGEPKDHITIHSPVTGVVVTKDVHEGHYVDTGKSLYSVADTSVLWAELEAFESDLPWLHLGQAVTLETDSLPGRSFEGELSFVEPWLDRRSRTARLRIEVPNPRGELRPEMLVRAKVRARIGADGRALGTAIDGSFACPMHPGERSDEPGDCSICGMPLEPLADLASGFVPSGANPADAGDPLVIPASAPLLTGRRAVVYVDTAGEDGGREYSLREIVLGPRAGDLWVVLEGLEAGERVVTRGAFKLDSELELTGSVSWMSSGTWDAEPEPEAASYASPGAEFDAAVGALWSAYLDLAERLALNEPAGLMPAAAKATAALAELQAAAASLSEVGAAESFASLHLALDARLEHLAMSQDVATWRERFEPLSASIDELATSFGAAFATPVYRVHCPMAFDNRGADWLSDEPEVWNPYFGAAMQRCGEVTATLAMPGEAAPDAGSAMDHSAHEGMLPMAEPGATEEPMQDEPDTGPPIAPDAGTHEGMQHEGMPEDAAADPIAMREVFIEASLALTEELVSDRHFGAVGALDAVESSLAALAAASPDDDLSLLSARAAALRPAGADIDSLRLAFDPFSQALLDYVRAHAGTLTGPLRVAHCPMADNAAGDDEGASWLQRPERVWNPYFGDAMLHCGSVKEVLVPASARDAANEGGSL